MQGCPGPRGRGRLLLPEVGTPRACIPLTGQAPHSCQRSKRLRTKAWLRRVRNTHGTAELNLPPPAGRTGSGARRPNAEARAPGPGYREGGNPALLLVAQAHVKRGTRRPTWLQGAPCSERHGATLHPAYRAVPHASAAPQHCAEHEAPTHGPAPGCATTPPLQEPYGQTKPAQYRLQTDP